MASMTEVSRVIRDPGYAKRLADACDASPHCPPKDEGRQNWLITQIKQRSGEPVSRQTPVRWFSGEARPREKVSNLIAQILGVDPTWLFVGVQPGRARHSNKLADKVADSAAALLEVHEAMGQGASHTASKLRQAIAEYRAAG